MKTSDKIIFVLGIFLMVFLFYGISKELFKMGNLLISSLVFGIILLYVAIVVNLSERMK